MRSITNSEGRTLVNPHVDPNGDEGFEMPPEPPQRFEVRDPRGNLIAVQVRTSDKGFWWEAADGEPGLGGIAMNALPLYRCERLRTVPLEVPVILTEGGKDCNAVWRADMPAVGTMTGASGTPCAAALEVLRDRIVILWPDNDEVGRSHMERIAVALIGVARETRWLEIPGLPPKAGAGDVPPEEIPSLVRIYARVARRYV
jgi:hypothetical protein